MHVDQEGTRRKATIDVGFADSALEGVIGNEAHAQLQPELQSPVERLEAWHAELQGLVEGAPRPVNELTVVQDRQVEPLTQRLGQRCLARAGCPAHQDGQRWAILHDRTVSQQEESNGWSKSRRSREDIDARGHTWTMRVRPAISSDCPAITSAYIASWRAGYRDLLTQAELDVQAETRRGHPWGTAIGQSDRIVLVAEDDSGGILGVAECEYAPSRSRLPWLQMLYVIPSAWGTGTAKGLLHNALGVAHRAGHHTAGGSRPSDESSAFL